ncbi:MAG: Uma2 family endonuclease [Prochlorothrix sp.]
MADNTLQYQWIVRLVTNLRHLLKNQTAFVAGDLLWYPTETPFPAPAQAPDVLVALGRPPGDRGSYKQWQEDNIAPQVIFEILSPSNTGSEMAAKQTFYIQHGVLEMFFYDPQSFSFWGLVRTHPQDTPQPLMALQLPWTSPTLGIRLEMGTEGLAVFYPNGEPFKAPEELAAERDQITAQLAQTSQQLEQTSQQLEQTSHDRDRAFAKLRELGIDPATL